MSVDREEGRRRLGIVLGATSGALCALAMATVLVFYGPPVDWIWWAVMAVILVAAFLVPRILTPLFEWAVEGYFRNTSSR